MSKQRQESLRLFKQTGLDDNPLNWHIWKRAFDLGVASADKFKNLNTSLVSGSLAYQKAIEYAKFKHGDEYYDKTFSRDVEDTIYDFQCGFATAMKIANDR